MRLYGLKKGWATMKQALLQCGKFLQSRLNFGRSEFRTSKSGIVALARHPADRPRRCIFSHKVVRDTFSSLAASAT